MAVAGWGRGRGNILFLLQVGCVLKGLVGAQRVSLVNAAARWQHESFHLVTLLCTRCLLALFYLFSHAIVFFQPFNSMSVLFPFSVFYFSTFFFLLFPRLLLIYAISVILDKSCVCLPYVVCAGVCVRVCALTRLTAIDAWFLLLALFAPFFPPFLLIMILRLHLRGASSRIIDRLLGSPSYPFFKPFRIPLPPPRNMERQANYARKDRIFQKE